MPYSSNSSSPHIYSRQCPILIFPLQFYLLPSSTFNDCVRLISVPETTLSHYRSSRCLVSPRTSSLVPCPLTPFATRHLPNLSRTIVTTADMELLAWDWATPTEKPSIWALTLARLLAQTPGIPKVPWTSLVTTLPGQSLRETLAPGSGRPDEVTTEPRRMWLGHPHILGLHPGGQGSIGTYSAKVPQHGLAWSSPLCEGKHGAQWSGLGSRGDMQSREVRKMPWRRGQERRLSQDQEAPFSIKKCPGWGWGPSKGLGLGPRISPSPPNPTVSP